MFNFSILNVCRTKWKKEKAELDELIQDYYFFAKEGTRKLGYFVVLRFSTLYML